MSDPENYVREKEWLDVVHALEAEVERLRKALERIAQRGEVFDAKGTHSKWVCDIARAALAGEAQNA